MPKYARYAGRPTATYQWHVGARLYDLDPPIVGMLSLGIIAKIGQIMVSGVLEDTGLRAEMAGQTAPVWRLHTVVCTADGEIALYEAWIEGKLSHEAALNQLGYHMIGQP